jgi:hypothetical protein
MSSPGTRRESDGAAVGWHEAVVAWSIAAEPVLKATAGHYNQVITYQELGEAVQSRTGVRTRSLLMNWIGSVLENVALGCRDRGEPLLTCLCVHQDGTVGFGYAGAVALMGHPRPQDPEMHAAHERLLCYHLYADDVPEGGGVARLTRQEDERRRRALPPEPEPLCPVHNIRLPKNGRCDDCG